MGTDGTNAPPPKDDESEFNLTLFFAGHGIRTMANLAGLIIVLVVALFGYEWWLNGEPLFSMGLLSIPVMLGVLWLNQQERRRSSIRLFLWGSAALAVFNGFSIPGITTAALAVIPLLAMATSWLLGKREGWRLLGILAVGLVLSAYVEGNDGLSPQPDSAPLFHFLSLMVYAVAGMALGNAASRGLVEQHRNAKALHEALASREQEFRNLAENSPDNIIRYDRECRQIYANRSAVAVMEKLLGRNPVGEIPNEAYPDGSFSAYEAALRRVMASGCTDDFEFVLPDMGEGIRCHMIRMVAELDAAGMVVGAIALGRDITFLRESQRRLAHFIDNLPGIAYTFRLEPNGQASFPYISPRVEALYGLKPEQAMGDWSAIHGLAHPDDRPRIEATLAESARTTTAIRFEFRVCPPGLPERWVEIRSAPERQDDGSILWYGIMLDITERKQTEQALRSSDERLRLFFERQLVGMAIASPEKGWLDVNDKLCEILGYTHDELCRLTWAELTHPDDLGVNMVLYERMLRGEIDSYVLEKRYVRKDGGIVFVNLAAGCVRRPDRSVEYVLASLEDITERKALDAQLAEERALLEQRVAERTAELLASKQKFQRLVDDIGEKFIIYSHKPSGEFLYVSDGIATVAGRSREAVIGKAWNELLDWLPGEFERSEKLIADLVDGLADFAQVELAFRHPDGSVRTLQIVAHPVRDAGGTTLSIDGIVEDITERKKTEEVLRQTKDAAEAANRAKSQFLAAASHDLRQPLQAMGILLSTLNRTSLGTKEQQVCDHLNGAVRSLGEMLNTLLDISRLEAGVIKVADTLITPFDITEQLENECAPLAQARGLRFKLFFPTGSVVFRADRFLLLTMLRNIVGNAIKYTKRGGVLVGVRVRRFHLDFEVWDTGVGIAAADLPRIFDEFVQVGNPERARTKGLGLGLAIVKRLATLTGYEISCQSRPGRGTVFKVRVPVEQALRPVPLPAPDAAANALDYSRLAGLSVVLIEDDSVVAQALADWLAAYEVRVDWFVEGAAALASPFVSDADAYISDFRLPGDMTGVDVLDAIRQSAGRPINGMIITGDTGVDTVTALADAPWTVFHKPINPEQLALALIKPPS